MESLEIKSPGVFNGLLEKLEVPKKKTWKRQGTTKQQPEKNKEVKEKIPAAAAVLPIEKIEKMDSLTILDGLDLKYNGVYGSEELSKILTKLQLITEGEKNKFIVSISLQEKKE